MQTTLKQPKAAAWSWQRNELTATYELVDANGERVLRSQPTTDFGEDLLLRGSTLDPEHEDAKLIALAPTLRDTLEQLAERTAEMRRAQSQYWDCLAKSKFRDAHRSDLMRRAALMSREVDAMLKQILPASVSCDRKASIDANGGKVTNCDTPWHSSDPYACWACGSEDLWASDEDGQVIYCCDCIAQQSSRPRNCPDCGERWRWALVNREVERVA